MLYKQSLFQNQFVSYLTDDFWKPRPKCLPIEQQRKYSIESEIDFQSSFHFLLFLQSICSSESSETNSNRTHFLTRQHLNIEPASSAQNEDGTWCSYISEPELARFFKLILFYLKQKYKWKTSSVFKYFQDNSISSELVEKVF